MNIPPANPYASRAGLARLYGTQWFVFERVEASDRGEFEPVLTHAALEDFDRTLCGRRVQWRMGVQSTDTISMIECEQCKTYLETRTL